MRLRLEMDAMPRLIDMLLFVFIVRHFFMRLIDYRSFACSLTRQRAETKKGCSPFGLKIRVQNEVFAGALRRQIPFCVWRFFSQKAKE